MNTRRGRNDGNLQSIGGTVIAACAAVVDFPRADDDRMNRLALRGWSVT